MRTLSMVLMTDASRDVAPVRAAASAPSPADRDRAIARLSDAFATDVLAVEEFERRLDGVYRASALPELDRLVADLPVGTPSDRIVMPLARRTSTQRVRSVFSNVERRGFHDIPSHLELRASFANMELDLRSARFGTGVTEISVHAFAANVEVTLPAGSRLDNEGTGFLASFDCVAADDHASDWIGPTVRITGWAVASHVEVRCAVESPRVAPIALARSATAEPHASTDRALPVAPPDTPNPMPPYRP